jgi:transcriptional regulator with XRE-family HTH domain
MAEVPNQFAQWLNASMRSRGLSQAALARQVGVADAQVSRWRRGQVTPSVKYLQRLAQTFGVSRTSLDAMAGYPVALASGEEGAPAVDTEREAALQAYQARYREVLERRVPPDLWAAYTAACEAVAKRLSASFSEAVQAVEEEERHRAATSLQRDKPDRGIGFHTPGESRGQAADHGGRIANARQADLSAADKTSLQEAYAAEDALLKGLDTCK